MGKIGRWDDNGMREQLQGITSRVIENLLMRRRVAKLTSPRQID